VGGAIFVCFEGVEGSGKTTQAQILQDRLNAENYKAVMVREPGTTPLGQHLRDYLKSSQPLSSKAELLLFAAARAELVGTTIKPNLDAGISIIADRFEASSMAYQGFGRKLSKKMITALNNYVTNEIHPDLTILLDLQTDEEMKRIGLQLPLSMALGGEQTVGRIDKENQRRFEDLPTNFHKRVRSGFLDLAEKSQDSWVVLDARLTIDELAEQVWNAVSLCFDRVNAKLAKINVN
jgi:dTMP kinase